MFDDLARLKRDILAYTEEVIIFAKGQGNDALLKSLNDLKHELEHLRYNIAIMGFMKRGKSTLLNVLMRRANDDISPVRTKPCTAVIVRYMTLAGSGLECEGARVHFVDSNRMPQTISISQVRDFVDEENNPGNLKGVRQIDIFGKFPILNDVVALVDTPGKGSIHTAHDAIADEILPTADALILPICSDLPIEASERAFLKELNSHERERVFVVLTKTDELEEGERAEVEAWVQSQLADTGLMNEKMYGTAAKPVFTALKSGKNGDEIEALVLKHGIKELEAALESFIMKHSDKNEALFRRLQTVANCGSQYCQSELAKIDGCLKCFEHNYAELNSELGTLEGRAKQLRMDREKALRSFEREWNRHVERFKSNLINKEDRIADRLIERFDRDGLLAAASRRPLREVTKAVAMEVQPMVADLADNLEKLIEKLNKDFADALQVYIKRTGSSDLTATVAGWGGLTGLGAGTIFAGTATSTALSSALVAWGAFGGASTTATTAASQVGAWYSVWAWLLGSGATNATVAATAATTAQAAALTTAITATATAVLTGGIAIGGTWLASKAVKVGLRKFHGARLPKLLAQELEKAGDNVEKALEAQKKQIVQGYEDSIEDLIHSTEDRLEEIAEAIKNEDPQLKLTLEEKREHLLALDRQEKYIVSKMKLLTVSS